MVEQNIINGKKLVKCRLFIIFYKHYDPIFKFTIDEDIVACATYMYSEYDNIGIVGAVSVDEKLQSNGIGTKLKKQMHEDFRNNS